MYPPPRRISEMTRVVTERTYKKLPFTLEKIIQNGVSPVTVLTTPAGRAGTHHAAHAPGSLQDSHRASEILGQGNGC